MLKSVYALVGSDVFLQIDHLTSLLRQAGDAHRIDLDGETAQLAEVLDELRTFTMFASAKVVVMRNGDDFLTNFREPLEDFLRAGGSTGTLILRLSSLPSNQRIYKVITQVGQICDCNPPKKANDLINWAIQRSKVAHKAVLPPDAARLLVDLIGNDLGRLDNELAKLALCNDDGKIDAKTVGGVVSFQREQEMWKMTDELAAGHTEQAIKRWRQLLQTDPSTEYRAVTWLVIWLEKVRKALYLRRQGRGDSEIAGDLKIWPREQVGPFFQTAGALGEEGAARLVDRLAAIDYQSKTGVGDMAANVERFLLSIAAETPGPVVLAWK